MDDYIDIWYQETFPDDPCGEDLREEITFQDLWDFLKDPSIVDGDLDFYDVIGVGDSVVRERLFDELAYRMDVDYDTVYRMWMDS